MSRRDKISVEIEYTNINAVGMIYLKPNCSAKYIVPTGLILFICLISTNISFLTELCNA